MRCLKTTVVVFLLVSAPAFAGEDTPREKVTCGVKERVGFWAWRRLAGDYRMDWQKAAAYNISKATVHTGDGRTLVGAHLHAAGEPKGAILVIQGNAWAAATLVPYLDGFREMGFDVFVYDFRGYGMSTPGTPRLNAIIEDYREIFADIRSRHAYRCLIIYGFSFGGMIALDSLALVPGWHLLIVDSAPSRVSDQGCPKLYDAVNNLPQTAAGIVIISGGKDRVVPRARAQELIDSARQRGATIWLEPEWQHPWQTYPDSPNEERYRKLKALVARQ